MTYPGGSTYKIRSFLLQPMILDKRLSISGNVYATIDVPFIKGLSYKFNFNNTYINTSKYSFLEYGANFRGSGSKLECKNYDWTSDNIISYKKIINKVHNINATLLYGAEKRTYNSTMLRLLIL